MYKYICINFCAVVECGNRSDREKEISFNHLPAVISVKVQNTPHELTKKKRHDLGLTRIHRQDLGLKKYSYTRVCSLHFISGNLTSYSQVH